jgi:glycosyltransferase involved in cell wall biosynthesis
MNYVSIIMCHFSQVDDFSVKTDIRSELLRKSIDSIIQNTDYPAEFIVIDNGGEDDDSEYLLNLTRKGLINTYLRNKDNMHFGWAWNQGVKLATSEYIFLTCNDLYFKSEWLSSTVYPLMKYPDKDIMAAPFVNQPKYNDGCLENYRLNRWAGSNCMLLTKKQFYHVGEYTTHHLAGSIWQRKMISLGYKVVVPPLDYAENIGRKYGLNDKKNIVVKKRLMSGQEIDFSDSYNIKVENKGF